MREENGPKWWKTEEKQTGTLESIFKPKSKSITEMELSLQEYFVAMSAWTVALEDRLNEVLTGNWKQQDPPEGAQRLEPCESSDLHTPRFTLHGISLPLSGKLTLL
jgi:hypothetical protein